MIYYKVGRFLLNDQGELTFQDSIHVTISQNPLSSRDFAFGQYREWMTLESRDQVPRDCEIWILEERTPGKIHLAECVLGRDYDKVIRGLAIEPFLINKYYPNVDVPLKKLHLVIDDDVSNMIMFATRLEFYERKEFDPIVDVETELTVKTMRERIRSFDQRRRRYLGIDTNL